MLHVDKENGMFLGVCSGFAKEFGIDLTLLRIIVLLSFFFTGSVTFWIYLILAVLMNTTKG